MDRIATRESVRALAEMEGTPAQKDFAKRHTARVTKVYDVLMRLLTTKPKQKKVDANAKT